MTEKFRVLDSEVTSNVRTCATARTDASTPITSSALSSTCMSAGVGARWLMTPLWASIHRRCRSGCPSRPAAALRNALVPKVGRCPISLARRWSVILRPDHGHGAYSAPWRARRRSVSSTVARYSTTRTPSPGKPRRSRCAVCRSDQSAVQTVVVSPARSPATRWCSARAWGGEWAARRSGPLIWARSRMASSTGKPDQLVRSWR